MRQLNAAQVHAQKTAELGLDPSTHDLSSVESVAAALRRAAAFLCPCTAATLVRAAVRPLRGLVADLESTKDKVAETLEAIIAHGDIIEERELADHDVQSASVVLYAAPPSFVSRRSGSVILLGVASEKISAISEEMQKRVECQGHVRRLISTPGEDLRRELLHFGIIEVSYERWLKPPPNETAAQHAAKVDLLLNSARPSREIPGLLLLDPSRPVRYYPDRWVQPGTHSGRFVARRSQAYGADLWCYVEMRGGQPERLIDFPLSDSRWRGCDHAWRLQLAIDAKRREPQRYRVRRESGATGVLELFSPLPAWARRRWDAVGEPVSCSGALFAYRFTEREIDEELKFVREILWLDELRPGVTSQ